MSSQNRSENVLQDDVGIEVFNDRQVKRKCKVWIYLGVSLYLFIHDCNSLNASFWHQLFWRTG